MKNIELSPDSIFSIKATDLLDNILSDKTISSYHFMIFESKKLEAVKDKKNFSGYLWEYSAILKALIKNEMLIEMQKRIENLDTFYN